MASIGFRASALAPALRHWGTQQLLSRQSFASALSIRSSQVSNASLRYSQRRWASDSKPDHTSSSASSTSTTTSAKKQSEKRESAGGKYNLYGDEWEDTADYAIKSFDDLPHRLFGANQHMIINYELKEALRLMLRQFNAPIVYCFAYGSGVFTQGSSSRSISDAEFRAVHPKPPDALVRAQKGNPKIIDFIFGVTHVQHWHSINMRQHRDHYSGLASLGSAAVSKVQDWGAGVYYHPYVEMNGMLIKYGVTSIDNLVSDLSQWDTLYLAGRLQKPVKILRDHPRVRLANQHNLLAAVRTALLLLPPQFTEAELYSTIAGLSYLGDPRMSLPTEDKGKVNNIVDNNMVHFRRLYAPLVRTLPNVAFVDPARLDDEDWVLNPQANHRIQQDMDPLKRGNMVRRLPRNFRSKLYFQYQKKFGIPGGEFAEMMRASSDEYETSSRNSSSSSSSGFSRKGQGNDFERRIAGDDPAQLRDTVRLIVKQTVNWPSTVMSLKGLLTSGFGRTIRYLSEKMTKYRQGQAKKKLQDKEKKASNTQKPSEGTTKKGD